MDNFTRAIDEGVKVEYIFRTALMRWGSEAQIIKACEELAELSAALLKYANTDDEQRPSMLRHIREEMADAEIMLEQLALIFRGNYDVYLFKLWRLSRRLGIDAGLEAEEEEHDAS